MGSLVTIKVNPVWREERKDTFPEAMEGSQELLLLLLLLLSLIE